MGRPHGLRVSFDGSWRTDKRLNTSEVCTWKGAICFTIRLLGNGTVVFTRNQIWQWVGCFRRWHNSFHLDSGNGLSASVWLRNSSGVSGVFRRERFGWRGPKRYTIRRGATVPYGMVKEFVLKLHRHALPQALLHIGAFPRAKFENCFPSLMRK